VHAGTLELTTRTEVELGFVSSGAGTVTTRLDGLTEDGIRLAPPHSTTDAEQKFAPVIVTAIAALPAVTKDGFKPLMEGGVEGAATANVATFDAPGLQPEPLGLTTRTNRVPAVASKLSETVTTRLDGLMDEGVRFVPNQSTTEAEQKFAPEMVMAMAALPAGADEGFSPLIEGGAEGDVTVKVTAPEVPGLQPEPLGLTTRTKRVPAVTSKPSGAVTTRLDGLTDEGVRFVPPQSTTVAEQKFAPAIVTCSARLPAIADEGFSPLIEGGAEGDVTVKVTAPEVPGLQPERLGLTTRTD
jgi:hypothetical protein